MRIAIGKETVEVNEDIIRGVQMVVYRGLHLEQYIHNYSARMWIDAILSHMVKMIDSEKILMPGSPAHVEFLKKYPEPVFTKEEKERIAEMQKPTKKVEIDIDLLNSCVAALQEKWPHLSGFLYSVIEKAEKEERISKKISDHLAMHKDLRSDFNFTVERVDQLVKRIEELENKQK